MLSVSAGMHGIARILKWMARVMGCSLLGFSTTYASGWVSTTQPNGPNAELCRALLYRLNHSNARCTATAITAYPGFQNPPWETLDASKHIDLIAKLAYVASPGWPKNLQGKSPQNWEYALAGAKEFVQEGGTLQIWHTRLLKYYGDRPNALSPPGEQTIALLSTKVGSRAITGCPASAAFRWSRTFVVLSDLSGPDTRIGYGIAALLRDNYPVLYKEQTLLINQRAGVYDKKINGLSGGQVIVYPEDSGSWAGCWFEYHGNDKNSFGEN